MHDVFDLRQLELASQPRNGRAAPRRVRARPEVDVHAGSCDLRAMEGAAAGPGAEAGRVAAALVVSLGCTRLMPVLVWRLS